MSATWGYIVGGLDGKVMYSLQCTDRGEVLFFQNGAVIIQRQHENGCEMEHVIAFGAGQWKYVRPIHADEPECIKAWPQAFEETKP